MQDKSSSWPLFQRSAEDLVQKLNEVGTADAMSMAREARDLANTFRSWESARPANDLRIATIQSLFGLNRRVMDYLSQQPKRPAPTPPPASGARPTTGTAIPSTTSTAPPVPPSSSPFRLFRR